MLAHFILLHPQVLLLPVTVVNLSIGVWVLLEGPRKLPNCSFFVLIVGSSVTSASAILMQVTHVADLEGLTLTGSYCMLYGLTSFAYIFPSREKVSARFFLVFIPLVITEILIVLFPSSFLPLLTILVTGYLCLSAYFFTKSLLGSRGKSRMQMLYLFTGIGIFLLSLLVFDVALPFVGVYQLSLLGPATFFVFVVMTGFAIIRHPLMDIRTAIQRGLIYFLLLSFIICLYAGLLYLSESFFDAEEEITTPLFAGFVMIMGIITFPGIRMYFQRVTDYFFFKDRYSYPEALERLSKILNENIQSAEIASGLVRALDGILRPEYLYFTDSPGNMLELNNQQIASNSYEILENTLTIPVSGHQKIMGMFTFGPKKSGDPYTNEDRRLLRTVAGHAAVAFEKGELYQELQEYSKSLEEKVHERTRKLVEMQASQRELFDDISHALQTPLTILKGGIQFMKEAEHSEIPRTLEPMERGVDDLSRLIQDILLLAQIDSASTSSTENIHLSTLVENIIEYVEIICRQNDILVFKRVTSGIYLQGNERRIEEVLINLLSNAVRYTSSCPRREITVTLERVASYIELAISDTGIGIEHDRLPHIFERFYRAQDSNQKEHIGHGIGLAIVKRIVEQHHGTICAESVLGSGTKITVCFPVTT